MFVDTRIDTRTENCPFFACKISVLEISLTLSITMGWFAITSNWSIVPDRRNIYTKFTGKIMKFTFKMENGGQAFPPRDNSCPMRGQFFELSLQTKCCQRFPKQILDKDVKMAAKLRNGSCNLLAEIGARMILFAIFMWVFYIPLHFFLAKYNFSTNQGLAASRFIQCK